MVVFTAMKKNNLYNCYAQLVLHANYVNSVDKNELWHRRLGRMSSKGLEILQEDGSFGN